MKTLSIKNYTTALLDFFTNNRSLAGSVSKWVASNTVETVNKTNPDASLTACKRPDAVMQHLQ